MAGAACSAVPTAARVRPAERLVVRRGPARRDRLGGGEKDDSDGVEQFGGLVVYSTTA